MTEYTIGITTYDYRFNSYFVKLIDNIRKYRSDIPIIVAINGNYNEDFNEEYRKNILDYCSKVNKVFPIIFPTFRGLSKLWNTLLIHSTCDKMLILNDDISIISREFFDDLEQHINNTAFKINGSWSHYFIDRTSINELGWFDERMLGIGEEDGDMEFRWGEKYDAEFPSITINNIINHVEYSGACKNMKTIFGKYSAFNRAFIFNTKYSKDESNGLSHGMIKQQLVCDSPTPQQYPLESFFWKNKHLL